MIAPPHNRPGELRVFAETDEISALCLEGEFDRANSPEIVEAARRLLANEKHVILDLSGATFIDSSVIHALFVVESEAETNGRVAVLQLGTAAVVERVLEITGVERVLTRASTRAEAIDTIIELQLEHG